MAKRKRRKSSSAKKTWRFIQKQRRRRKRLHPMRRRQENLAIAGGLSSVVLLVLLGPAWFAFAAVAALGNLVASKGSPPPRTKTYKPPRLKNLVKGGDQFSGRFSHKQAVKLTKGHPCDKTCKYSTHDVSTCICSCGGKNHGIWAWGPAKAAATPPKKRKTRRRRRKR